MDVNLVILLLIITANPTIQFSLKTVEKGAKALGIFGTKFGVAATSKGVQEAYVKYQNGEEGAYNELMLNIATLAAVDVGALSAIAIEFYAERFIKKKLLTKTQDLIKKNNLALYDDAKDIISKTKQNTITQRAIKHTIEKNVVSKQVGLKTFGDDIKAIKQSNPSFYRTFKANTKWLRTGGKVLKGLGPLFDVISLGFNAYTLAHSERGTNEHTSAAIGVSAAVIGILGFFAGLLTFVFPPAGAAAFAAIATGATVVSAGLGIASTVVGLIPDAENGETPSLPPDLKVGNPDGIGKYNTELVEVVKDGVSFLNLTASFQWEYYYVMSQANLVDWTKQENSNIKITGNNGTLQFGLTDPIDQNRDRSSLNCLPYQDVLNVTGFKQNSDKVINSSCSQSSTKVIGYDFVGHINNYTAKPNETYQGVRVMCFTNIVKDAQGVKYRGLKIDTESENFNSNHKNGNDFVLLDDMRKLDDDQKIIVKTGGGDDTLSITGYLENTGRPHVSRTKTTNSLEADLGKGFDILSFDAMPKQFGTFDTSHVPSYNGESFAIGIQYNIGTGNLYYIYIEKDKSTDKITNRTQHVGTVKGVNSIDGSHLHDRIYLDVDEKLEDEGLEDFGVINRRGENQYHITIKDSASVNRIRRFIILDQSKHKPSIYVDAPDSDKNRITFKRDKQLVLYSKSQNSFLIFAVLVLLQLPNSFNVFLKNDKIPLKNIGVRYSNGKKESYNIKGEGNFPEFAEKDDQLLLTCNTPDDLKGSSDLEVDMKGGNDAIVIGRRFFESCEIEPASFEGDLDDSIGEKEETDPSDVKISYSSGNWVMEIVKEQSGVNKKVILKNTEFIIDDQGTTILELGQLGQRDVVDLLENYTNSFGYDVEAIEKAVYFGGKSEIKLNVSDQAKKASANFNFSLTFKPERYGIVMYAEHQSEMLEIALLENGKVGLLNPSGTILLQGKYIKNGWNTVYATSADGHVRAQLNSNPVSTIQLSSDLKWEFNFVSLGYHNIDFSKFNVDSDIVAGQVTNIKNGFRGDFVRLEINGEEQGLLSKYAEHSRIDRYENNSNRRKKSRKYQGIV